MCSRSLLYALLRKITQIFYCSWWHYVPTVHKAREILNSTFMAFGNACGIQSVGPNASLICGNRIKVDSGYRLPRGLDISMKSLLPHEPWDYFSVVLPRASPDCDVLGANYHEHVLRAPYCCCCMRNGTCQTCSRARLPESCVTVHRLGVTLTHH